MSWYALTMDEGVVDGPFPTKREALADYRLYPYFRSRRFCPGLYEIRYGFDLDDSSQVDVATEEAARRNGYGWAIDAVR